MVFRSLLFTVFLAFSSGAMAMDVWETCDLAGQHQLAADLQIVCDGDLRVAADTVIDGQNQFEVHIRVLGSVDLGTELKVVDASSVSIRALTAAGRLTAENIATDLELVYASITERYDHSLKLGEAAQAQMVLNGNLFALVGPELKPHRPL